MCIIGLDIHRGFGEAVAWEDGRLRRLGRVDMQRDRLRVRARRGQHVAAVATARKLAVVTGIS